MNTPVVSVIMPAYNAADYIQEAIDSVIAQTFTNWELIIIDDGSTDATAEIIKNNSNKDHRIKCFYQQNQKQSKARNFGITNAKGLYIAFLDADDISLPERFEKQVAFFEANPDVVLCGSWFSIIGSDRIIKLPEHHEDIKLEFLKRNSIAHSSVMIRKDSLEVFQEVYDASKEPAEDYDLWVRLVTRGKFYNLQEVLLDYRTHINQLSKKKSNKQKKISLDIKLNLINFLELELTGDEHKVLIKILNNEERYNFDDFRIFKRIEKKLLLSNSKFFFEPEAFSREVLDMENIIIQNYFIKRKNFKPSIFFEYLKIKNSFNTKLNLITAVKLFIKSIIFFKSYGSCSDSKIFQKR